METAPKLTHDITINALGPSDPLARRLQSLFRSADTVNATASTNRSLDLPMKCTPHLLMRTARENPRGSNFQRLVTIGPQISVQPEVLHQTISPRNAEGILKATSLTHCNYE